MRIAALVVLVSMLLAGSATGAETRICAMPAADFKRMLDLVERALDGNELIGDTPYMSMSRANGYVEGVSDMLREGDVPLMCAPDGTTKGDVMTVVVRRWKAVMDRYDLLPSQTCASSVITLILVERFPCPEESAPPAPAK